MTVDASSSPFLVVVTYHHNGGVDSWVCHPSDAEESAANVILDWVGEYITDDNANEWATEIVDAISDGRYSDAQELWARQTDEYFNFYDIVHVAGRAVTLFDWKTRTTYEREPAYLLDVPSRVREMLAKRDARDPGHCDECNGWHEVTRRITDRYSPGVRRCKACNPDGKNPPEAPYWLDGEFTVDGVVQPKKEKST